MCVRTNNSCDMRVLLPKGSTAIARLCVMVYMLCVRVVHLTQTQLGAHLNSNLTPKTPFGKAVCEPIAPGNRFCVLLFVANFSLFLHYNHRLARHSLDDSKLEAVSCKLCACEILIDMTTTTNAQTFEIEARTHMHNHWCLVELVATNGFVLILFPSDCAHLCEYGFIYHSHNVTHPEPGAASACFFLCVFVL